MTCAVFQIEGLTHVWRRTANVIAEGPTVVYRLRQSAFDKMQAEDPGAAAALHKMIIRLLSDRLEFANREISALL